MSPPYLSESSLVPYTGKFSFISSRLYSNIRHDHPTYDPYKPKTFVYITLATIQKHCPYQGYPDLPEGVAYERRVLETYEAMYTAVERAESAMVNGALHKRYPFNYDQSEKPKEKIGMSKAECRAYTAGKKATSQGNKIRKGYPGLCDNWDCARTKQETAKLRGTLSEQRSELQAARKDLKEYVAEKTSEIQNLEATVLRVQKDHTLLLRRAEMAEHECTLLAESRERKAQRIKDLGERAKYLERFCALLQEENAMFKSGRAEKRPREELGDGAADSDRVEKRIKLEKDD